MAEITHGELFAGISGFGSGFASAGIRTVWAVEIDPDAQRVLRRHLPDALHFADVRECGRHNLPPVDVISFGSPCQDLSVAGKRKGLAGERSGLFHEAIRIVDELRPAFAVFENVPGLLSSDRGRDFACVLRCFHELGARDVCWRTLDAQHFGVAQRRRRVFVVADFGGERAGPVLFESSGGGGHPAPGREAGAGLAPSVTPGAQRASGQRAGEQLTVARSLTAERGQRNNGTEQNLVTHALTRRCPSGEDGTGRGTPLIAYGISSDAVDRSGEGAAGTAAERAGLGVVEDASPALRSRHPNAVAQPLAYQCHGNNVGPMGTVRSGNGGLTGGVPFVAEPRPDDEARAGVPVGPIGFRCDCGALYLGELNTSCPACGGFGGRATYPPGRGGCADGWQEFLADLAAADPPPAGTHTPAVAFNWQDDHNFRAEEGLANPLRVGQTEAVASGMVVRRLTPVECCRLQGFPDNHLDLDPPLSDSARYRLLGNAVCRNVSEWIGKRIMLVLGAACKST